MRELRFREWQVSPHLDKGCGSLPARRYDLLRRARGANLAGLKVHH